MLIDRRERFDAPTKLAYDLKAPFTARYFRLNLHDWDLPGSPRRLDLCIYAGSELPMKLLSHRLPHIPEGYDWDICTDDALLHILSADNGRLKARGGMEYQALVVKRPARLTDEAEAKIAWLKEQGVPVYDARMAGDDGLDTFLDENGITPDVTLDSGNAPDNRVLFAHRTCGDADIYFFCNHSGMPFKQSVSLRQSKGKVAEIGIRMMAIGIR